MNIKIKDYDLVSKFIELILASYKNETITMIEAIGDISHLIASLDRADGDDPHKYMMARIRELEE